MTASIKAAAVNDHANTYFSPHYLDKAIRVFLRPSTQLAWQDIVPRAVAQNTFRGFHRINKNCPGAKQEFVRYFIDNKDTLIVEMSAVDSREELHSFINRLRREVHGRLGNVRANQLKGYNKVRKPVDLYIEHLVSMARELESVRARLIPLLFLPLDSWIFGETALFSDQELRTHSLTRRSTYKDVESEDKYLALQRLVEEKAKEIGAELNGAFCPIYFDLLWNERSKREGENLFETNP